MKIVFAGTPAFSVAALDALLDAGHDIVGVYTQPDRPAGRGQKLQASAVAQRAHTLGLPLFKPPRLRGVPEALAGLRALSPDLMVVVAYGLILPQDVLDIPRHGCFNIHASLLPRWRGAAPIQRAILAGDTQSGVTIMQMDAGLDTGPMLLRETLQITPQTTAGELHDALAELGARLIVQAVEQLARGTLHAQAQPDEGSTYAPKLDKLEARLDFLQAAAEVVRRIHGYNPVPGAWCLLGEERVKLLRAHLADGAAAAGTLLGLDAQGLLVACGEGAIRITELQRPGGRPGHPLALFRAAFPPESRLG